MENPSGEQVREYLEFLSEYAGVGFEAVTDRDIGLTILAPDFASQWTATRGFLKRHQEVEDQASREIREHEARIQEHDSAPSHWVEVDWVDQMHDKAFLDAAHSMAAVGLLAPLVESLFSRIVRYYKGQKAWEKARHQYGGIAKAIPKISEAIGLRNHLPDDLDTTVSALFAYRNKMFHQGLEWPEEVRVRFAACISAEGWTNCFSRAESGNDPWFFYMTRGFVERCLDTICDIIDGLGAYARPSICGAPSS